MGAACSCMRPPHAETTVDVPAAGIQQKLAAAGAAAPAPSATAKSDAVHGAAGEPSTPPADAIPASRGEPTPEAATALPLAGEALMRTLVEDPPSSAAAAEPPVSQEDVHPEVVGAGTEAEAAPAVEAEQQQAACEEQEEGAEHLEGGEAAEAGAEQAKGQEKEEAGVGEAQEEAQATDGDGEPAPATPAPKAPGAGNAEPSPATSNFSPFGVSPPPRWHSLGKAQRVPAAQQAGAPKPKTPGSKRKAEGSKPASPGAAEGPRRTSDASTQEARRVKPKNPDGRPLRTSSFEARHTPKPRMSEVAARVSAKPRERPEPAPSATDGGFVTVVTMAVELGCPKGKAAGLFGEPPPVPRRRTSKTSPYAPPRPSVSRSASAAVSEAGPAAADAAQPTAPPAAGAPQAEAPPAVEAAEAPEQQAGAA